MVLHNFLKLSIVDFKIIVKSQKNIDIIKLPYEEEVYLSRYEKNCIWNSKNSAGPIHGIYYRKNPKLIFGVDSPISFLMRLILD